MSKGHCLFVAVSLSLRNVSLAAFLFLRFYCRRPWENLPPSSPNQRPACAVALPRPCAPPLRKIDSLGLPAGKFSRSSKRERGNSGRAAEILRPGAGLLPAGVGQLGRATGLPPASQQKQKKPPVEGTLPHPAALPFFIKTFAEASGFRRSA